MSTGLVPVSMFKIFSYDSVDRGAIRLLGEIFRHLHVKATIIGHRYKKWKITIETDFEKKKYVKSKK